MKVVVVGDVLLDVDITGRADRLSPDAPVPVIDVSARTVRAGGAGLVAALLERDGCQVELVTVLSDDARGAELRAALGTHGLVAGDSGAATPVKTRLRAGTHAIARFDDDCGVPPVPEVTADMLASIRAADVLVVADYGRGLLENTALREALSEVALDVPLVWDPHPRGAQPIAEATAVTPNLAEALAASGVSGESLADACRAAQVLRERWGAESVVVTLGARGALLEAADEKVFPAPAVSVADTCGAGDRFAATLARQLGEGWSLDTAVHTAVVEAAEFLHAGGVAALAAAAGPAALPAAVPPAMAVPVNDLAEARTRQEAALGVAESVRSSGGTVVATGGCFDIVHAGHARTLQLARELGDCLIVCLNSDESVRRLKGPERPIMSQEDRAELLLALGCVDAVMIFDEDTPEAALSRLVPDVWVKGGDYSVDDLPESKLLATWGGRTITVPFHPGRSTTKLAGALARVS